MATLRASAIVFIFFLVTVPLLPVQWLAVRLNLGWRRSLPHAYHRFVCWLFGVRITVIGKPALGGVLLAANQGPVGPRATAPGSAAASH